MTDPITHANTLAEIDELKARIAALERERDGCDALRERMADLLTRTTNALKGEPAELELHSWHDLPDVAVAIRSRIAALEAERDDAESRYNGLHVANRALIDAIAVLERRNAALVKAVEEELNWQTELADEAGRAGNPFADNRSQAIRDCVRDIRAALAAVEAAGKGVNNAE